METRASVVATLTMVESQLAENSLEKMSLTIAGGGHGGWA